MWRLMPRSRRTQGLASGWDVVVVMEGGRNRYVEGFARRSHVRLLIWSWNFSCFLTLASSVHADVPADGRDRSTLCLALLAYPPHSQLHGLGFVEHCEVVVGCALMTMTKAQYPRITGYSPSRRPGVSNTVKTQFSRGKIDNSASMCCRHAVVGGTP